MKIFDFHRAGNNYGNLKIKDFPGDFLTESNFPSLSLRKIKSFAHVAGFDCTDCPVLPF